MKTRYFILSVFCMGMMILGTVTAQADILTSSSAAPVVDGADIAQLDYASTWLFENYPNVSEVWGDKPVQGQTFTTGSNPGGYLLNAITLRCANGILGGRTFVVQVGEFTETGVEVGSLNPIASYSADTGSGMDSGYITMTLGTPLALAPNKQYGFDWRSPWSGGMQLYNAYGTGNNNPYAGGGTYWSGENATPDNNNLQTRDYDRVFHLDITAVPEPSALTMLALTVAGMLAYAWRKR